jgi:general stress protein 26
MCEAQMDVNELLRIARDTIDSVTYCFAITVSQHGEAHARIILPRKLETDWSVDFGTIRTSRKCREIESSHRLTLAYQNDHDRAYVSLMGQPLVIDDIELKRSRWAAFTDAQRESALRWNPKGPEDPDLVYIRLMTERIEMWSIEHAVLPEPLGFSAAVLTRNGDFGWTCSKT